MRIGTALVIAVALAAPGTRHAAQPPTAVSERVRDLIGGSEGGRHLVGRPLDEVLRTLRDAGLPLVFSSGLVRPEMRVVRALGAGDDPLQLLAELLRPHGLAVRQTADGFLAVVAAGRAELPGAIAGTVWNRDTAAPLAAVEILIDGRTRARTDDGGRFRAAPLDPGGHTLEARRPGFVVARRAGVAVPAGEVATVALALVPAALASEEIVVRPSYYQLLHDQPAPARALGREEVERLPHLGDDPLRAIAWLPGIAGLDLSAESHVRGGNRDETLYQLDGLELYRPFHSATPASSAPSTPSCSAASRS